jgi:hypothetical protein
MKLKFVVPLPYAPDVVMRAMTTPQFHINKITALGAIRCELLEEGAAGSSRFVRIRRSMRQQTPVPGPLAKLVPSEVVLNHRDEWDPANCTGSIDVQVEGVPVRMQATVQIAAVDGGYEQRFEWEIKSPISMIGGVIERFVAQDLERSIRSEAPIVRELLKQYV